MLNYYIVPRQCGLTTFLQRISSQERDLGLECNSIHRSLHLISTPSNRNGYYVITSSENAKFCGLLNSLNYNIQNLKFNLVTDINIGSCLEMGDVEELRNFILSGRPIVVEGMLGLATQYRLGTMTLILAIQRLKKEMCIKSGDKYQPIPVFWFDSVDLNEYQSVDTIINTKNLISIFSIIDVVTPIYESIETEIYKEINSSDIKIRDVYGEVDKTILHNAIMNVLPVLKNHPLIWLTNNNINNYNPYDLSNILSSKNRISQFILDESHSSSVTLKELIS